MIVVNCCVQYRIRSGPTSAAVNFITRIFIETAQ